MVGKNQLLAWQCFHVIHSWRMDGDCELSVCLLVVWVWILHGYIQVWLVCQMAMVFSEYFGFLKHPSRTDCLDMSKRFLTGMWNITLFFRTTKVLEPLVEWSKHWQTNYSTFSSLGLKMGTPWYFCKDTCYFFIIPELTLSVRVKIHGVIGVFIWHTCTLNLLK